MIRRLREAATRYKAVLAKHLFAKRLVLTREKSSLNIVLAYARIDGGRKWRDR
jgi:hypothetical protein